MGANTHKVAVDEDEGSRVVRSCRLAFVPMDASQTVLEIRPDGVTAPIAKVACRTYNLLLRAASRAFECTGDLLQESFTAMESGA